MIPVFIHQPIQPQQLLDVTEAFFNLHVLQINRLPDVHQTDFVQTVKDG